jgi:hypothetical protein
MAARRHGEDTAHVQAAAGHRAHRIDRHRAGRCHPHAGHAGTDVRRADGERARRRASTAAHLQKPRTAVGRARRGGHLAHGTAAAIESSHAGDGRPRSKEPAMTKLVILSTLVGSLLVAGVASADTAPRADARTPAADRRGDRDLRSAADRPRLPDGKGAHQLRTGDGGCVGKAHGKKGNGKRLGKRGPRRGDDRGAPGPRAQRPGPRNA